MTAVPPPSRRWPVPTQEVVQSPPPPPRIQAVVPSARREAAPWLMGAVVPTRSRSLPADAASARRRRLRSRKDAASLMAFFTACNTGASKTDWLSPHS